MKVRIMKVRIMEVRIMEVRIMEVRIMKAGVLRRLKKKNRVLVVSPALKQYFRRTIRKSWKKV